MKKDHFGPHSTERTDKIGSYLLKQARKTAQGQQDLEKAHVSATVYIGNLSFYTTEEQVYELLSKVGPVRRVIMGLDRFNKTPCGFCFVEYFTHEDSLDAVKYINNTKLDDRIIQIDRDPGFTEGRQYGRGLSGGQKRDEYRQDFDAGRGGYGGIIREQEQVEPS